MIGMFSSSLVSFLFSQAGPDKNQILPKMPASGDFWLPSASSPQSDHMDPLFYFLMWLCSICTILVLSAMIWFAIKYRAGARRNNQAAVSQVDHSTALELTWSVIPFAFTILIFVWGFKGFVDQRISPKDSYEIYATGQKWKWTFQYPGGYVDDRLHVPQDRNVRVLITTVDVLHSLFLPNFRTKIDAVPGRYTEIWFHPRELGTFPVFCAEYCGTQHSDMLSELVVHAPADFDTWLAEAIKTLDDLPPVRLGERMFAQRGCGGCHAIDGSVKTGPPLNGAFGRTERLLGGGSVRVDEEYIRQSLLEPQSKIVEGYPPSMPTFKGQLNDKQLHGIIEYIKTLK